MVSGIFNLSIKVTANLPHSGRQMTSLFCRAGYQIGSNSFWNKVAEPFSHVLKPRLLCMLRLILLVILDEVLIYM